MTACFLREFPGRCWPHIDRAHLIPKRLIKAEFLHGAMSNASGRIVPQARIEDFCMGGEPWHEVPVDLVVWDPRVIAPCCRFHHGQLDNGVIRPARELVPVSVFDFAEEYGLCWLTDRLYPHEEIAA